MKTTAMLKITLRKAGAADCFVSLRVAKNW